MIYEASKFRIDNVIIYYHNKMIMGNCKWNKAVID